MIIPLHAGNPSAMTGSGNWTYLLTGRTSVLIDAGVGDPTHISAIAEVVPNGPAHVIVTHAHDDHIAGATVLARSWPNARFWKFPWPERDAHFPVRWNALVDAQVVPAGDDVLHIVHTPGHAPDHICLWHAVARTLFCGDLLVLGGTVVIPASAGGNLRDYLASLARVAAMGATRLLPAHGQPIEDPTALIREYVAHRRQREQQVLDAVATGTSSVAAMVDRIYAGLSPPLRRMAEESVLAHLRKLEADGMVARRGDHWITLTD